MNELKSNVDIEYDSFSLQIVVEILCIMYKNNINYSDLSEKTGKDEETIRLILSGSHNMTIKTLFDISRSLGLTPKVDFEKS